MGFMIVNGFGAICLKLFTIMVRARDGRERRAARVARRSWLVIVD
jgi:hypothetical protein